MAVGCTTIELANLFVSSKPITEAMADFTLLDSETEIEASRGTSRTRGNMSEGSSIEGPQRTRLLQHLKDLHEENKTLLKLVADEEYPFEMYIYFLFFG
ncbi:hypothetical protein ACLB2K_007455 [Fragaria x ananassa]